MNNRLKILIIKKKKLKIIENREKFIVNGKNLPEMLRRSFKVIEN